MDNIELAKILEGLPYREEDINGCYMGCLEPVYCFHKDLPRYKMPEGDFNRFMLKKFKEHCKKVDISDIMGLDIIICKIENTLHVALYLGQGKIIEVYKGGKMRIDKVDLGDNRIVRVYRWV